MFDDDTDESGERAATSMERIQEAGLLAEGEDLNFLNPPVPVEIEGKITSFTFDYGAPPHMIADSQNERCRLSMIQAVEDEEDEPE